MALIREENVTYIGTSVVNFNKIIVPCLKKVSGST